jgi:predicted DNA-binding transcriptional regulator AlpA
MVPVVTPALSRKVRTAQIAAACGVSDQTILNWWRRGQFPKPQKIGRVLLWDAAEVNAFLAARQQEEATHAQA